jgi:hypothetical protein
MITAALTAFAGLSLRTKLESAAVVAAIAGGVLAWAYWPAKPVPEIVAPAPEVRQADGSMELRRAPDANPAPPPHIIPRGFHEERREQFAIAPAPAAAASGCPPVRVALSVVSDDRQHRVIASSPDGQVVDAVDIPIQQPVLMPAPARPWAAGMSYDTRHAVGIWVDRDVGRLVVGGALSRLPDGRTEAQVRVGVRF